MRSSNPTLNDNVFRNAIWTESNSQAMTLNGVILKTGMLLAVLSATAVFTWTQFTAGANVSPWMIGGMIGGLVLAMITTFKPTVSPYTAPLYAAAEGFAMGGLSAALNSQYPGVALQAVGLTVGTLTALLLAYSTGLIRATEKFKLGIVAATGGIMVFYLVAMVLGFFGVQIPGVFGNGAVGIGFSVVVVVIAALNLILDFDFIETGVNSSAPKYMEWYAGFSLLVTLIWLYIEILRLMSKLRSRD